MIFCSGCRKSETGLCNSCRIAKFMTGAVITALKNSDTNNKELKILVGKAAAQRVKDGMVCGIGAGSTVTFLITELGRRIREEGLDITVVPTSFQSRLLCQQNLIPVKSVLDCTELDLAIDSVDEVDHAFNAIKGDGAAQTRGKIVAAMAKQFILISDESKLVTELGKGRPVPVEIIPDALRLVTEVITKLGKNLFKK
jgi:ribose 5-phosphate isomerase